MHPGSTRFVSELFYDGRLETDPDERPPGAWPATARASATDRSSTRATRPRSSLEADRGRRARRPASSVRPGPTATGGRGRSTAADILVVAPYNAHVAEIHSAIERRIGGRVRVGTVDKFQGQEAPVSIFSTATSSPDELPRDMEFLYSGNRLNVAVSRARGLAIVVSSPDLLTVACRTAEQMRLVNAFCRLVEVAADQAADPTAGATGQQPAGDDAARDGQSGLSSLARRSISSPSCQLPSWPRSYWRRTPTRRKPTFS